MRINILHPNKAKMESSIFSISIILTKKLSISFAIRKPISLREFLYNLKIDSSH